MTSIFPWLVAAFTAGLVLGAWWPLSHAVLCLPLAAAAWLAVAGQRGGGRSAAAAGLLLFASLGLVHSQRILWAPLPADHVAHLADDPSVDLEGVVIQSPDVREEKTRLVVAARVHHQGGTGKRTRGPVLLTVAQGGDWLRYGDRIRLRCRLRAPRPAANPGEFQRDRVLALQGVRVQGFVAEGRQILLLRRGEGAWPRQHVERLRCRLSEAMRAEFPSPSREILLSLIVGGQSALPAHWRDAFAAVGLSHLLAISGLNFGLLALIGYASARWLLLRSAWVALRLPVEKVAWSLTVPVLMAYGGIAGMGPSVQRALVMILALLTALLLDRVRGLYHALALAALAILLWQPAAIFDISFQLSFLAVLGILYAVPRWQGCLLPRDPLAALQPPRRLHRWARGALLVVLTSLAALLATLPVSVLHFHLVPVAALPANLLAVPPVNILILPLALLGSALHFLWESAGLHVLWACAWLCDLLAQAVRWGAGASGGGIYLPTPRPWEVFIFYAICVGLCHVRGTPRFRWATLGMILILAALWSGEAVARRWAGELRVHCLSVGNGLSVFVEGPGAYRMLLDGGGWHHTRADIGAAVVAPVLWHRRVLALDRVILSHPHPDHMGGLGFVLRAFRVASLWDNGESPASEAYEAFRQAAAARELIPAPLGAGARWSAGAAVFHVLHPPGGESNPGPRRGGGSQANNRSIVLRIALGGVSFLLPGDIEAERESWLARREALRSTVLVAPHHGSRTSSSPAFLAAVAPRCVVFSSDEGPRGLAHPAVVARYREAGARVFHTGDDGMVSLITDGRDLQVRTHLSRRAERISLESARP